MPVIDTALTRLLGIEHPILLAPMGSAAGGELAAAVTHAGGLGIIGSGMPTPRRSAASVIRRGMLASASASFCGRSSAIRWRSTWRSTPIQRR
jgi:nitronate monooxygenase